ncbi:MAG TPA: hypothetical protein VFU01_18000 [Gemmatimonadaceae bacterium]|nr:hypothetical protein [Gemmatimonadaceae bacterium]
MAPPAEPLLSPDASPLQSRSGVRRVLRDSRLGLSARVMQATSLDMRFASPTPLRAVPALSLVVIAVACLHGGQRVDPLAGGRQVEETPRPTQQGRSTPERGIMPKRVIGKQDLNLLLADDDTSCAVSAERYRDIQIGKYAVCAWR